MPALAGSPTLHTIQLGNKRSSLSAIQVSGTRKVDRSPERERRLQEAKFNLAVIRAVRQTINSERWQREHKCTSLQQVWKLWMQAAAGAEAKDASTNDSPDLSGRICADAVLPSSPGIRAAARASRAARAFAARQPQRKLDIHGLQAALAFTFPDGTALAENELHCVYRSLDQTRRGHVTLSTFSSVFAPHRSDQNGRQHYYQSLPTWGETVGGYIPKNEKELAVKRNVSLQHGKGGVEMPEDARGVAGGFGLGHQDPGGESLGWQMLIHGDLDANVLK